VWVPKDPENEHQKERTKDINKRWLGIQNENIEVCAKRGDPGVVVVASQPAKALIVARVMGFVTHLIISQDLAEAIIKLPDP